MFIEPRKPVTVDELMRGMIVQSGNDACIALAEAVAGSEEAFAQLMNREAAAPRHEEHAISSTRPGLPDPQHYTTAQRPLPARRRADPRFPRATTRSTTRRRNSATTTSRSRTATACCGSIPTRRRREDRPHRDRGLLPDRLVAPRRPAAALGPARLDLGIRARAGIAEAAELGLPVLRQRAAATRRRSRCKAIEVWKGAANAGEGGLRQRPVRDACPKARRDKLKASSRRSSRCSRRSPRASRSACCASRSTASRSANSLWSRWKRCALAGFFGRAWDTLRLWFK